VVEKARRERERDEWIDLTNDTHDDELHSIAMIEEPEGSCMARGVAKHNM
jgi:hypothetical protein